MTLLPSSDFGIRGHPGNAYDVNEVCAHPECQRPSAHAHHCWPRSYLRGQPYEWVVVPLGPPGVVRTIGNRLGFCVEHHDMLTGEIGGYRARLEWDEGLLWWVDKVVLVTNGQTVKIGEAGEMWRTLQACSSHPPVAGQTETTEHDHSNGTEQCPTCGHITAPEKKYKPGKLRPAKDWVASVPADNEDGTALLDEIVEDLAIPLGMSDYTSRLKRYHVLSVSLAWVVANRQQFIRDVAEAAERRLAR